MDSNFLEWMCLKNMTEQIAKIILDLGGTLPSDDVEMKLVNEEGTPLWCVYMHTSPSGKYYIGITSQEPHKRWGNSGNQYRKQKSFWSAISHYGWDSFKHEILSYNLSESIAKLIEIELIKELNTTNRTYGYNVSLGGDGSNGVISSRRKKVICLNTLEIFDSVSEIKEKLGVWPKGDLNKHPIAGKYVFEYYDPAKTYEKVETPVKCKTAKIVCLTTLEKFSSILQVCKKYRMSQTHFINYMHTHAGDPNYYYGSLKDGTKLVWDYYNADKSYVRVCYNEPDTRIICLTTLCIFQDVTTAAKEMKCNQDNFKKHLKRETKYCCLDSDGNGMVWCKYEEGKSYKKEYVPKEEILKLMVSHFETPVICLNSLCVYKSIIEAHLATGANKSHIGAVCLGKRYSAGKSKDGQPLVWRYYDPNEHYQKLENPFRDKKSKKIRCVETGVEYDSVKKAAIALNINQSSIRNSCVYHRSIKKLHFEYVEDK